MNRLSKILPVIIMLSILTLTIESAAQQAESFKLKFYGIIKLELIKDSSKPLHWDWLSYAASNPSNSVLNLNARNTRLGLQIEKSDRAFGQINGLAEIDFADNIDASITDKLPFQLRHLWIEVNRAKWAVRFGQDWALISGPFPNSADASAGAYASSLWQRTAQIAFTFKPGALRFDYSLNRPIILEDDSHASSSGNLRWNGGDIGKLWQMFRMMYKSEKLLCSISSHHGSISLKYPSDNITTQSWNTNIVWKVGSFNFSARYFWGKNLSYFFGGIGQGYYLTFGNNSISSENSLNVPNFSHYQIIRSIGGWFEVIYDLKERYIFTLGIGGDNPNDDDLNKIGESDVRLELRSKNVWTYGSIGYRISQNCLLMMEVDRIKTTYFESSVGDKSSNRFHLVTFYSL